MGTISQKGNTGEILYLRILGVWTRATEDNQNGKGAERGGGLFQSPSRRWPSRTSCA